MKKLSKIFAVVLSIVCSFSIFSAYGCGADTVLKVYNCYDYIDEDLIEEFEDYYKETTGSTIDVVYSCFDTPEDAYNMLLTDGKSYDLLCPSDYMIEKMAVEGMLQTFELEEDGNYNTYVSPYIKSVFDSISCGEGKTLSDYAAGYMWGTLGLVYNPETVSDDDMTSWSSLWLPKYDDKYTIKDSVRDTYFIGLAKYNENALNDAKNIYQSNKTDATLIEYQNKLKGYFNPKDMATLPSIVGSVKSELINLADSAWGLEVDSGKEDIIKGNIDIYFAWSGDAVYAMDVAEESDVELKYSVPDEGSNVWFDGWCIPKASTKTEEAKAFIEFLSKPENAIRNMDYIGYVSVIAGDEIFDYVKFNYEKNGGRIAADLSYFFGGENKIVMTNEINGKFSAQYPTKDIIDRCVIMEYFPDDVNDLINNMWIDVVSKIG